MNTQQEGPIGPQVPACELTHAKKHRLPGEPFREAQNRIAAALKDDDDHFHHLRDALLHMRFAPGGRIQVAMGAGRSVTAYNCFVGGDIEDSWVEGEGSIMARATEAAATLRMGGGLGNNFSSLRPKGELIRKLGSRSGGILPFLNIFNAVGEAANSAGDRNGAEMGVLNIDHPQIFDWIHAKQPSQTLQVLWDHVGEMPEGNLKKQLFAGLQETLKYTRFNLSIGVTDEFMEAKQAGKSFKLRWDRHEYQEIDPNELWEQAMRSTWDWGEPGVLFLDTINRWNPLYYCENLNATNPCGEQPLPPYGACLLGSFNLTRYIYRDFQNEWTLDWEKFQHDIPIVVRAMDNVVDRSRYPLPEQEIEAKNKRRMGLGVFGLANAGEVLGFPYGSPKFILFEEQVLDTLRDHAYAASAKLAKEKGSFPLYDAEKYQKGLFFQTLSPWVQELIKQCGLRNSHLLSLAPTGTMAFTHDNTSSSIEPVIAYDEERDIREDGGYRTERIQDYGVQAFGVYGKRSQDVTIDEHLAVLATATRRVDSAVSKTCNVSPLMAWDDFKAVYDRAWELQCKGVTTFNIGGKRFGVRRSLDAATSFTEGAICSIDPNTGRKSCE